MWFGRVTLASKFFQKITGFAQFQRLRNLGRITFGFGGPGNEDVGALSEDDLSGEPERVSKTSAGNCPKQAIAA